MRTLTLGGIGLTALIAGTAHGFAPTDTVHVGIEPQRILRVDPVTQARLAEQRQWQTFTRGEGAGWLARFDQKTGTPHRMWGPGLDLGPTGDAAAVERALQAFLDRNAFLLGVPASALRTRAVHHVPQTDTWIVQLDRLEQGAPVWRGGVSARFKAGKLVMLGVDTYPDAPLLGRRGISGDRAAAAAVAQGPAPEATHEEVEASLVWLPREQGAEVVLQLCWEVRTRTSEPPGIWVHFVDAATGDLLHVYNQVRFASGGTVTGVHDLRTVNGEYATSPMPYIGVTGDTTSLYADVDGTFDFGEESESFTMTLRSDYLRVRNDSGSDGSVTWAGGDHSWTTDDATQAEIDTFVFLHQIQEWGERVNPDNEMVTRSLRSTVNIAQVCNAYFDGNVNFYSAGSGCNNTGRIADVNYHEWGHGFHYFGMSSSMRDWYYDGSFGEGAADVVAFLQTGDSVIAPYFMTDGQGIRNQDNTKRWPDDYVDNQNYVHSNGLIYGGAMWDLWGLLIEAQGQEQGTETLEQLFSAMLAGAPSVESSYDEIVVADDDDGDLTNGTPHGCLIYEAFGLHGLGPNGGRGPVNAVHLPEGIQPVGEDHPVEVGLLNYLEACAAFDTTAATVTWRVDGGDWQESALTALSDGAEGAIPEQPLGSFVEYYLTLTDAESDVITAPSGGYINPFSFWVGDVLEIHCDDFEEGDAGYTHELLSGEESLGADDWQWGVPLGEGGDPSAAASGSYVWGNDLGDGDYNGEYQNEKTNRLTSPTFDTFPYSDVFLHYQRWLQVEDGYWDRARIYADGEVVWDNWNSGDDDAAEHHQDEQWQPHAVDLQGLADDGSLQLAWEIESDQGLSFGGWTLDDVCIYAPATPDNRLAITDFLASDGEDGAVELTWTNPRHGPVDRVVVVRKQGGWPSGPTDGTVVHDDRSPELEAPAGATDTEVEGGVAYYYAAYATDGTDWLSWTVEGMNADQGEAQGDDEKPEGEGCGCSAASAVGGGWMLPLLGLLAARRRW